MVNAAGITFIGGQACQLLAVPRMAQTTMAIMTCGLTYNSEGLMEAIFYSPEPLQNRHFERIQI
jgi:hypothetical protein